MGEPGQHVSRQRRRWHLIICVVIAASTIAVYLPLRHHEFLTYDDGQYVTENAEVRRGLSWDGFRWAFTTAHASNYHPLTWLSHMLDWELFGARAGAHHLTSLALHAASAVLLYLALAWMTGCIGRSAFVAALFALHPLRVESVAWIAERKDVLCALFFMLALHAYRRYALLPSMGRYLLLALVYVLGLLAKPMILTLPFVLLLLDVWPLQRERFRKLLAEKVPLIGLSAASAGIAILVQHAGGATASLEAVPLASRIGNALVSTFQYIGTIVWPRGLAVLYPLRDPWPLPLLLASGLALLAVSALVLLAVRRHPYLFVGWFWYLVMLLPVCGIVQIGWQAMADRYTYLPSIGLSLMAAWGISEAASRAIGARRARAMLAVASMLTLAACAATTRTQLGHWRTSRSLYERALAVTDSNALMHYNLGNLLAAEGDPALALAQFRAALAIDPELAEAHVNLGNALRSQGDTEGAIRAYRAALRIDPGMALAHDDLGLALADAGRWEEAAAEFREAARIAPARAGAFRNLGRAELALRHAPEALAALREALRLDPDLPGVRELLAAALEASGKTQEAVDLRREIVRRAPADPAARRDLADSLRRAGRGEEAMVEAQEAVQLAPGEPDLLAWLAGQLAERGDLEGAASRLAGAVGAKPADPVLRQRLAVLLEILGRGDEARTHYCEALRIDPRLARLPVLWDGPASLEPRVDRALAALGRACPVTATGR